MREEITYLIKKIIIVSSFFRKDISVDFRSLISPQTYRGIRGTNRFRTIIRNSVLSGNLSTGIGCRLFNVYCSGNVELGRFVSLNGPGTRVASRLSGIKIGSFTSIASNVVIQEDYHRYDKVSSYFMNQNIFKEDSVTDKFSKGPIVIEEDVWIGSNSVVLSGVTIGRGSIIGAGSIVTKDIPRYSIVAGNPAKVIKRRFPEHVISKLESSRWWEFDIETMRKFKEDFNKNLLEESNIFEEV
ncbi:CatB-related O-acetyltransferase [Peribacillus asahii]|uniref:CatB-related O-acetyltransferase n=1 Tax=Peribacillus asahii TaxID=228899 RepID=UPI00207A628D|nr:CatB-related O-acetyltransferase [Peribacillus asahii]USK59573.1 CatB-related O-acetyltransferase [Peribacillus asahii]